MRKPTVALGAVLALTVTAGSAAERPGDAAVARPCVAANGPAAAAGAPLVGLRLYSDEIFNGLYSGIAYSLDADPDSDPGTDTPLSQLTTQGYATGGALVSASIWDFTPSAAGTPAFVASVDVPIDLDETCNAERCGFSLPANDFMGRQDNMTTNRLTVAVFEIDPAGDTFWLRAGAQNEGTDEESRFCFDGAANHGAVPQWKFPHPDGGRFYMEVGDVWEGTLFDCFPNLFNENCGESIFPIPSPLYTYADGGYAGKFTFEVLSEGSAKLPSGHWADVLVLQQTASWRLQSVATCDFFPLFSVRQPVVQFLAPNLGVVVQINGPNQAADPSSWTEVTETVINFGLLPPLDIQVVATTEDSVTLSWDPGDQFGFIDRAKVYWDTDSGDDSPYAFNSDTHPGQVAFDGDSATISCLAAGVSHSFTVTFLDTYSESDGTPNTREYESMLYPETFTGNGMTYPVEVTAATGASPTDEVQNLTVTHAGGGDLTFAWDAVADACLDHYLLLGADTPESLDNYSEVADTGGDTTYTGNPAFGYYLVVAGGTGGAGGALGHYGQ